ncbi:hypothetical protein B8V81_1470 [Paenibacillus pasadenensis]|uniref:Uncharacterized protein n=1 Tax=Paenibacillus pasadenensis TaxID=217090 RepID=A0A2N5NA64_9BACL|nr:hypothetical protein B8V81_1470 [Paenibacillus pasadenensis]
MVRPFPSISNPFIYTQAMITNPQEPLQGEFLRKILEERTKAARKARFLRALPRRIMEGKGTRSGGARQ